LSSLYGSSNHQCDFVCRNSEINFHIDEILRFLNQIQCGVTLRLKFVASKVKNDYSGGNNQHDISIFFVNNSFGHVLSLRSLNNFERFADQLWREKHKDLSDNCKNNS
jgi:hypothetical protein